MNLSEKRINQRLWSIVKLASENCYNLEGILVKVGINERVFRDSVIRLKKMGIEVSYDRSQKTYRTFWPKKELSISLSPEELFHLHCGIAQTGGSEEINRKVQLAIFPQTIPVFDQGPAYGISQNITSSLSDLFLVIKEAFISKKMVNFLYHSPNKEPCIRTTIALALYHTPISWYYIGFCDDRKDIRTFKCARMDHARLGHRHTQEINFSLEEYVKDAWWIQSGNDIYHIKILFTGESAKTISEYNFHHSQKIHKSIHGSLVTWELSYLGEFASWLMQWIGSIEIIEPQELKELIDGRLKDWICRPAEGEL